MLRRGNETQTLQRPFSCDAPPSWFKPPQNKQHIPLIRTPPHLKDAGASGARSHAGAWERSSEASNPENTPQSPKNRALHCYTGPTWKKPCPLRNARQRDRSHAPAWERNADAPASLFLRRPPPLPKAAVIRDAGTAARLRPTIIAPPAPEKRYSKRFRRRPPSPDRGCPGPRRPRRSFPGQWPARARRAPWR